MLLCLLDYEANYMLQNQKYSGGWTYFSCFKQWLLLVYFVAKFSKSPRELDKMSQWVNAEIMRLGWIVLQHNNSTVKLYPW